jgi:pimeloyl-ACP methyl ester carboxylesterase
LKTVLKVLGAGVALLVVIVIAFVVWAWRNPLALYERSTRIALERAGLEKASLPFSAGELVYWVGGSGRDLIFLHGAGDQAGTWAEVVPAFVESHRVVSLDLPGHGDSDPGEGPLTVSLVVDGVVAFLEERGGRESAILVGNSLGAWVSMLVADRMPERVQRVIAVNGGPLRFEAGGLNLIPQDREQARRLMEALRDPSSPPVPDFVLDDIAERSDGGPITRLMAERSDAEKHWMDGRLHEFRTPVEMLWGESDLLTPVDYAKRMASELPDFRLHVIPRCGHVPPRECPERFTERLSEVLAAGPPIRKPARDHGEVGEGT